MKEDAVKISELMYGDPKFGKRMRSGFVNMRDHEAMRMRLGLPVGCGLSLADMLVLDAVTCKALADAV